jgi:hypothetical protein
MEIDFSKFWKLGSIPHCVAILELWFDTFSENSELQEAGCPCKSLKYYPIVIWGSWNSSGVYKDSWNKKGVFIYLFLCRPPCVDQKDQWLFPLVASTAWTFLLLIIGFTLWPPRMGPWAKSEQCPSEKSD